MDDDEELDTAPPTRYRRWLGPLAGGLGATLVVVAVVVALTGSDDTTKPRLDRSQSSSTGRPGDGSIQALATAPHGRFLALEASRLSLRTADGQVLRRSAVVDTGVAASELIRIVVDSAAEVAWLVPIATNSAGAASAYSLRDLHRVDQMALPAVTGDAAALDGTLYAATRSGLFALRPGSAAPKPLGGGRPSVVVADPSRHRVLLITTGSQSFAIRTFAPGIGLGKASALPAGLSPTLAVVGGSIWASYGDASTAVLARLDPRTLRPVLTLAADRYGSAATIVATGDVSLFLRPRESPFRLWCVDARDGKSVSLGSADGLIAASGGRVLVAPLIGPPTQFDRGECPG
ncbi:MAG: hypothetical protein ABI345_01450 [Jatrophihabitans sp.]